MERILPEKSKLIPTHRWRLYKANSIGDMVDSVDDLVAQMEAEHAQWVQGLDFRGKINFYKTLLQYLCIAPDTSTYITLDKGQKLPHIEVAPRALVFLPRVQHFPILDDSSKRCEIKVNDVTGTVNVEFPYGLNADIGEGLGFRVNKETARETSWSSPVVLFNIYGLWPRSFLMHIYNIKATEKVNERVKQSVSQIAVPCPAI